VDWPGEERAGTLSDGRSVFGQLKAGRDQQWDNPENRVTWQMKALRGQTVFGKSLVYFL